MTITLTDNAARRISKLINEESHNAKFRITVSGGGCKGFQYGFNLDNSVNADDHVFETAGIPIIVDEASLALIEGIQIDFVEELIGASFQVKNPNATTSCGCGNSFSI